MPQSPLGGVSLTVRRQRGRGARNCDGAAGTRTKSRHDNRGCARKRPLRRQVVGREFRLQGVEGRTRGGRPDVPRGPDDGPDASRTWRRPASWPSCRSSASRGARTADSRSAGERASGANFGRRLPVDHGGDETIPAPFVPGTVFFGAYWSIHLRHLVGSRQEMTAPFHIDNAALGYGLLPAGLPIPCSPAPPHHHARPQRRNPRRHKPAPNMPVRADDRLGTSRTRPPHQPVELPPQTEEAAPVGG